MHEKDQNRAQSEGQSGIDRETEQRNRENETGQAQGQQTGQQGQAASDTSLADRASNPADQSGTGGGAGQSGFVGSQQDQSSDYLTKGEQDQEPSTGQDTSAASSDIETGQSQHRDSELDDGSDASR